MRRQLVAATFLVLVLIALHAQARPGGGSTFRSSPSSSSSFGSHSSSFGSHSSFDSTYHPPITTYHPPITTYHPITPSGTSDASGGSGSSDPAMTAPYQMPSYDPSVFERSSEDRWLFRGVFLVFALVIGGMIVTTVRDSGAWQSMSPTWLRKNPDVPSPTFDLGSSASPAPILKADPDFSIAVFEDFAYELYAHAHRCASDRRQLDQLAAYLSSDATESLHGRARSPVSQVVVGALRVEGIRTKRSSSDLDDEASGQTEPHQHIAVRIESNLAFEQKTLACVEHWLFTRRSGVRSRVPVRTHTWPCPSCGAPWSGTDDGRRCASCGQPTNAGRFDWAVEQIWVESATSVGQTLTGTVEEAGTEDPTLVDRDARRLLASIAVDDPNVTLETVGARAAMIYGRLNQAWNAMDMATARGLVTRSMLDYLRYWISAYQRQALANRLDAAALHDVQLAKVTRDRYFDSITLRMFADGLDFTVDAAGNIVGGSRTERRSYTEYWTFLRSSARKGPVVATPSCPGCGAPLAISDGGACEHCGAEVENGSFDFVLSKIEQDESYSP